MNVKGEQELGAQNIVPSFCPSATLMMMNDGEPKPNRKVCSSNLWSESITRTSWMEAESDERGGFVQELKHEEFRTH